MKKYELSIGKNGGKILFEITDENRLNIAVSDKGETYKLKFADCIMTNRFTHDPHQRKFAYNCGVYNENTLVEISENKIIFKTIPVKDETKEEITGFTAYNIFTIEEDTTSFKLETYFESDVKLYDCALFNARVKLEKDFFDTFSIPSEGYEFKVAGFSDVANCPDSIVLKGEGRYLEVCGGMVEFDGSNIDAHIGTMRYNDDLTYYGKDNPLVSYFMFEEMENPKSFSDHKKKNVDFDADVTILECGTLKVDIAKDEHSLFVIKEGKKLPLCAMRIRNINTGEDLFIDTLSEWESVNIEQNGNSYVFALENKAEGEIPGIGLKFTAEVSAENNQIEWVTEFINNSEIYSLMWCNYPRLYLKTEKDCNLFEPVYGGNVVKGFNRCNQYTGGTYPSGFWYPMPYYALYEDTENPTGGIYYTVHDKDGSLKEFYAHSDNEHNVTFTSRFYAENMYQLKNSNTLPGKAIWKVFDGDWYDATNIYREFVRNNCDWAEEETCKKTPDWMKEVPFWIMDWVPYDADSKEILPTALRCDEDVVGDNDWYENAIKIRKEFDTPIAYHVYNWHQIPFNNNYPHFVPARERFLVGYKELKKNDIRVMPYINAILWDTEDTVSEEYKFATTGIKGAVKKANGEPETLVFESKRENGDPVKLAPMCPTTDVWKNMLIRLIDDMFGKYDFDAIYLDQIAARVPHLCMDKTHGHPLGGGSWWQKGYNDIVKALNERKPEDKGFTTECNAEVFTNTMNAFLSWRWQLSENDVPAFMRIYSDRVIAFGRNTNGKIKNDAMYWKYNIASEFVSGQQLGWINSDIVKSEYRMNFLKQLVRLRYANKEFFSKFEVLRPPVVVENSENTVRDKECVYSVGACGKPYFCTGVLTDGKKKLMFIVNIADRDMTSVIKWKKDEYNFDAENYIVIGEGNVICAKDDCIEVSIKKESVLCIEWR